MRKYFRYDRPSYVEKTVQCIEANSPQSCVASSAQQECATQNQQHQGGLLVKQVTRFLKEE